MNKLQRDDSDRRYFSMTPHIAKMLCENVYELALWTTVKMICGEGQGGECVLSTEDLAILSDMSCGKTSDCRRSLIDKKLIEGELKRDDGFPRPVWHLKIPDLYPANLELMQNLKSLKKRIQFKINQDDKAKTSLRTMKGSQPSQDEGQPSHHEGKASQLPSHHEANNNSKSKTKSKELVYKIDLSAIPLQNRWGAFEKAISAIYAERGEFMPFQISSPGSDTISRFFKDLVLGSDVVMQKNLVGMIAYCLEQNPDIPFRDGYDLFLALKNGLREAWLEQKPYTFDRDAFKSGNKTKALFLRGDGALGLGEFLEKCRNHPEPVFHVLAEVADEMKKKYITVAAWRSWVLGEWEYALKLADFPMDEIKKGFQRMKADDLLKSWDCKSLYKYTKKETV